MVVVVVDEAAVGEAASREVAAAWAEAVVVVVRPAAVEADKVVEVADVPVVGAEARVVVVEAAGPAVAVVAGKAAVALEVEEVAVVVPAEAGAAGIANLLFSYGAPNRRPFFRPPRVLRSDNSPKQLRTAD